MLHPPLGRLAARHPMRGQSMVELMVGLAVGLVVVGAAATLLVGQLREQRAQRLEARLVQDLGSAADLIARDLRRAGHWGDAVAAVWSPTASAAANPYATALPAGLSDSIAFSYTQDAVENGRVDDNERFGWRLRAAAVELRLGGRWQAVTDASVVSITAFSTATTVDEIDLAASCSRPCEPSAAAAGTCPPRQQLRSLVLRIAGHATADARVARSLETRVRMRNDTVDGACAA